MAHYGMLIDLDRCLGCNACAMACKKANNTPEGVTWNKVYTIGGEAPDTANGTYKVDNHMSFLPVNCQHCEDAPCVRVCPVGATYKDRETGAVMQDYDRCIGCRMCMSACPYTGVRTYNEKRPSYAVDMKFGDSGAADHVTHVVEKCTFCHQRTSEGKDPACMVFCPGHARIWGDLDDPSSEVSKRIREKGAARLKEGEGTKPSVYYVGLKEGMR